MERFRIKADFRDTGGKGKLNQLRRSGLVPGILYGRGIDPKPVTLNTKILVHAIRQGGMNALFELELDEKKKVQEPLLAMLKAIQTDVVSHQLIHVDLLRIDLKQKVTVKVPVQLTGKSVGEEKGGIVDHILRELEVECLPTGIPESIVVDIHELDVGHNLHVKDLKLPEGVAVAGDVNFTIVSVTAPRKEEELAPAAAAVEGAAPVIGEEEKAEGAAEAKPEGKATPAAEEKKAAEKKEK